MKTALVVQTLERMAENSENGIDFTQLRALLTASVIIRSLPKLLLASMDILLDVEDSRPKP